MWNSRPPPFMEKNILNFHFDYLIIRLKIVTGTHIPWLKCDGLMIELSWWSTLNRSFVGALLTTYLSLKYAHTLSLLGFAFLWFRIQPGWALTPDLDLHLPQNPRPGPKSGR